MYCRICILVALIFNLAEAGGQDQIRKLPPNINRPSVNLFAPFISGDGQTIVYLTDYTDDGHHSMRWSTKKTVSTWNDELEVNRLINRPTLNYRGGYSLTFDGNMLLFTSRKSGIGGYDLWYSHRRGTAWEAPGNFGMPVNSRENEGAPMISPDGEYLYFMRCEKMSEYGLAGGCSIWVSKKSYNGWEEPTMLPSNINTGNSQTPRILADGETMIFASDQFSGKGGLDLFMTTKNKGTWADPVPMDFINSENHDQFISIPAKGRYLFADVQGERDRELVQILIPEEFQPPKVMRIQGEVTDAATGQPLNANLTVFNIAERDRLWNEKAGAKGTFAIVLKEGAAYDVAVDVDDPLYMYYSKVYNLVETIGPRDKENLKIELSPIKEGTAYPSDIFFEEYSTRLKDNSTFELRRMAALLKKNQNMRIEIAVYQNNYREDSVQIDPDLTELRLDSTFTRILKPIDVHDSSTLLETDALAVVEADSLNLQEMNAMSMADSVLAVKTLDSLKLALKDMEVFATDTFSIKHFHYTIIEELNVKQIYHNDRTAAQADAIKEYLEGRGVDGSRIQLTTARTSRSPEEEAENKEEQAVKVEMKVLQL